MTVEFAQDEKMPFYSLRIVQYAGRDYLKARARSENPHLFTWTVKNDAPVVPGADFVLDPATAAAGFRLRKGSTGLRLVYTKGMMIIVK